MNIQQGTVLYVTQKEGLATHLVPGISIEDTRALCGADTGRYPSYRVKARVGENGHLAYTYGVACLHHVDCRRCHALYLKKSATPTT